MHTNTQQYSSPQRLPATTMCTGVSRNSRCVTGVSGVSDTVLTQSRLSPARLPESQRACSSGSGDRVPGYGRRRRSTTSGWSRSAAASSFSKRASTERAFSSCPFLRYSRASCALVRSHRFGVFPIVTPTRSSTACSRVATALLMSPTVSRQSPPPQFPTRGRFLNLSAAGSFGLSTSEFR